MINDNDLQLLGDLANTIYIGYYKQKKDSCSGFELLDDVEGVVSQIDNMITGVMKENIKHLQDKNLSFISNEALLAELLSRTYESSAPRSTSYGDGMKTFSVGIGKDETAVVALHYNAVDMIRSAS